MSENIVNQDKTWALPEACEFIRKIEPVAERVGFCLAIGGGVLSRESDNDLNVVVLPRTDIASPSETGFVDRFMRAEPEWAYHSMEQQGDNMFARFWNFHTEKVVEFRFIGETDLL